MENTKKKVGSSSSSSSFTADLFGAKESTLPSTGIFASIFPPASTVLRRNSTNAEFIGPMRNHSSGSQAWSAEHGNSADNGCKNTESAINSAVNMKRSSIFQERVDLCPLSSSLYYGGQEDMYIQSSSNQTLQSYPKLKKDGQDDPDGNNLHSASRGNWWQGSLYY